MDPAPSPSAQALRCGDPGLHPQRVALRAGPLTCVLEDGDLRFIRVGGALLVQRLYAAVRDRHWGTIPFVISDQRVELHADRFRVAYTARHRQGEVDFVRRMVITGDADGTVRLAMDGEALSTFARNRLGFCVLHPTPDCAGAPYTVVHTDGRSEPATFPALIRPDQPCFDIAALRQQPLPGVTTEIAFAGEVFEMEDQRNYGDSSFKTYSTPQARPKPVEVPAGSRIAQAVAIRVSGPAPAPVVAPATLAVGRGGRPLPRLGLGMASHGQPLDAAELRRLAVLRPAHLRVELRLDLPGWDERLRLACAEAGALGAQLEVAALVAGPADERLAALAAAATRLAAPVHAWLALPADGGTTSPELLAAARRRLAGAAPAGGAAVLFGGGNAGNFMALNGQRPPASGLDAVAYAVIPQIHGDDTTTLFDNLAVHGEAVASAAALTGGARVLAGPISLKARGHAEPRGAELPASVDVRQLSLAGAAWTLGSIAHLAAAGAHSATYFETTGWLGVVERSTGSPLPQRFPSRPGLAFPLYHVLADAGEFAGGAALPVASTVPCDLAALALEQAGRARLLLANCSPAPLTVTLSGLAARVLLKRLDETTAWRAMTAPEAWRAEPGEPLATTAGALAVTLLPYALARLDAG